MSSQHASAGQMPVEDAVWELPMDGEYLNVDMPFCILGQRAPIVIQCMQHHMQLWLSSAGPMPSSVM